MNIAEFVIQLLARKYLKQDLSIHIYGNNSYLCFMEVVISIKKKTDWRLLQAFLKRLNINYKTIQSEKLDQKENPTFFLKKIAERGGISDIEDPSDWQWLARD